MSKLVPTNRIEAFSDGVIAIIITIMVFDLKLPEGNEHISMWMALRPLLPKLLSYTLSFLVLAIMWVNHHQIFHQVHQTDRSLLWHNIHLLFWMSLIPFATNTIGNRPLQPESTLLYGIVFFMCAYSFTLLRSYLLKTGLLHQTISKVAQQKIIRKNRLAFSIYLSAAILGYVSVYISFLLFLVVPAMYFMPEAIVHETGD
jgi:uncharacterized membrane protein